MSPREFLFHCAASASGSEEVVPAARFGYLLHRAATRFARLPCAMVLRAFSAYFYLFGKGVTYEGRQDCRPTTKKNSASLWFRERFCSIAPRERRGAKKSFPRRVLGICYTGRRLASLACPVLWSYALSALIFTFLGKVCLTRGDRIVAPPQKKLCVFVVPREILLFP